MSFPEEGVTLSMWSNGFPLQLKVTRVHSDGTVEGTISVGINPPVPFSAGEVETSLRTNKESHGRT